MSVAIQLDRGSGPAAPAHAPSFSLYDPGPTDAFGDYLRRIGRVALLSAEEEVDLARRIEVGLFAGERLAQGTDDHTVSRELAWLVHDGKCAKNQFIEANLRLVVSIAKHYSGRTVPIMDLAQDGTIGLVRAVEKYDFMTGFKFSTYATWWIRQAIHRSMADKSRMIRVPVHIFGGAQSKRIRRRFCRNQPRTLRKSSFRRETPSNWFDRSSHGSRNPGIRSACPPH